MTRNVQQLMTEHIDLWTSAIENKSSAGRGNSRKKSLYGIKKLRELILELAVRGKLVEQDPNDEPASELLKRIEVERDRLVEAGEIKKLKALPEIAVKDKLFELPEGWSWARLCECVDVIRGITFPASAKNQEPSSGLVACLRTANIQDKVDWDDILYIDHDYVKRDDQYLANGDIVMSMANSRELVGKVAYIEHLPVNQASFGGFLGVLRPWEVVPAFLMVLLRTPMNRELLIGSASQTTNIANISLEKLYPLALSIPPLPEQHRIVAKVDELMALCDQLEQQTEQQLDAHQLLVDTLLGTLTQSQNANELADNWTRLSQHFDTLFTTEASIDQLKQTILQLAVMGKLVPQNPNDEPASELLKRIAAEKEQLIKDKKIKKQKPLPPISDEEKPFKLPVGWEWVRFDDIVDIQGGIAKGRKITGRKTTIVPYLSVANVQRGYLDLRNVKEIELPIDEMDRFQVLIRDLLITEGGDWDKVGRTAIWNYPIEYMAHQNHVFKARLILDTQNEIWLEHFLNSKVAREYFAGSSKQTTNLASINKTQLRSCLMAIPPLNEQNHIIAKTSELFTLCDQLKERLQHNQKTQLLLTDTLVQEALV
ncbi:restriction endonuclease subunit S [Neptunomonas sp.]|uniref:restriction endonuclease subunit S n=1 Tax=Neptunomonas sp. TaxID=1971898 RepID=UPI0025E38273|nr:restriction endonuclease subunit S [Neptunomonas sp.]